MELAQLITVIVILLGLLMMVRSAIVGPTLMDRILAVNVIGTKTIRLYRPGSSDVSARIVMTLVPSPEAGEGEVSCVICALALSSPEWL